MSEFLDTDELYSVMHELWERIKADEQMSSQLLKSRLIVRFQYTNPDGWLTIDGSDGQEIKIISGTCDKEPIIVMTMKSDVAHNFWLGKEQPAVALLQGRIQSRGPVHKALALLPVVKPAFQIYPKVIEDVRNRRVA